ncbi:MAG TPA: prolyl oligopeptidase family serine peptidase, partial [Opitutaceae bacterium]|nr:prolyl oligopeptidase family serine peptidase [Opitutaceae bacterium]
MKITSSVKALVIGVLFLRGIGSVSAEIAHKLVPIEDFFSYSEISSVQVAPDGKHLAYLAPAQGRLAIMLFDLETGKAEVLARPTDENISFFFWKGSDTILYGGDLGGNESPALVAVNLKTRKFTHLVESLNERTRQDANFGRLVDALRFDPNHILIAGRSSVGSWHIQLSILDIRTAERKGIDGGDNETDEWIADNTGVIRARTRLSGEKNLLEVMPDSKSLFYPIAETPIELSVFGSLTSALIFAADNETLYLTKEDSAAGSSLYTYNTRTKQWSEPLFHIENGTIENVTLSWDRTRLIAARYITEEAHTKWFDPTLEKLTEKIKSSLKPETRIRLASMSQDEKVLAIYASSDVDPGTYYLLDLRGKPQLVQLGKVHSQLDPAQMQPMKPITYTARDGLVIHGYLTLPRGAAGKRVPLIINPHGGPYGIRDYWGYNPEVQFLANRGYAVLQANYRGSGGYGTKFLEAGKLEWGLKMQDDLTDAVNWAIDQGIADPKRVCIYGASYGGYAALAGVTYT